MLIDDHHIITFGKFKGQKLANVDAKWLMWIYKAWAKNPPQTDEQKSIQEYIKNNLDVLELEIKEMERQLNGKSGVNYND